MKPHLLSILLLFLYLLNSGCSKEDQIETNSRVIKPEGGLVTFYDYFRNDRKEEWSTPLVSLNFPSGAVAEPTVMDLNVIVKGFYEYELEDSDYVSVTAPSSIISKTRLKEYSSQSHYFVREDGMHILPVSKFIYFDLITTQFNQPVKITLPYNQPAQEVISTDSVFKFVFNSFENGDQLWSRKFLYGHESMFKLFRFNLTDDNGNWEEVEDYEIDTIANTVTFEVTNFNFAFGIGFIDYAPIRKDYFMIQTSNAENILLQYTSANDEWPFGLVTLNGLNRMFPVWSYGNWSSNKNNTYFTVQWSFPENATGIFNQNIFFKIFCYQLNPSGELWPMPDLMNTYTNSNLHMTVYSTPKIGEQLIGAISGDMVSENNGAVLNIEGYFNFTKTR